VAALGTEVVSDLRRATGVKHDRRTERSAINTANAGSPKYQRNLAVTSTANDGWKPSHARGHWIDPSIAHTYRTRNLLGFVRPMSSRQSSRS